MTTTKQQVEAALGIVLAVGDAIHDLGRVPSGTLYAHLMGKLSLTQYNSIISTLVAAGMVQLKSNELIWVGPKK